jgi:hypothetical protein
MPKSRGGGVGLRRVLPTTSHRSRVLTIRANEKMKGGEEEEAGGRPEIAALKQRLVAAVRVFKAVQARDGAVSVDFGVKGGELDGGRAARQQRCLPASFLRRCACSLSRFSHCWMSHLPPPAFAPAPAQTRARRGIWRLQALFTP